MHNVFSLFITWLSALAKMFWGISANETLVYTLEMSFADAIVYAVCLFVASTFEAGLKNSV